MQILLFYGTLSASSCKHLFEALTHLPEKLIIVRLEI